MIHAMDFLKALRPSGPWTLSAIVPDGNGEVPTCTFTDTKQVQAWVERWIGKANIYYQPNRTSEVTKKARAEDLTTLEFAHVDIDTDADGNRLTTDEQKAAVVELLQGCTEPGPPSFIIGSGNGIQALWRLSEGIGATPESIAVVGRINDWLVQHLGGDKGTWSPAQLMRLPGTVNLPDMKKRAKGLEPRQAELIEANGRAYDVGAFNRADPKAAPAAALSMGPAMGIASLDELDEWNVPQSLRKLIEDGEAEGKPERGRSEWLMAATIGLVRQGVPNEIIKGILTDGTWGIAASVIDKNGYTPDAYAERQISRAHGYLSEEAAGDFEKATPNKTPGQFNFEPYTRCLPSAIPARRWYYKPMLVCGHVTGTVAHGGNGKTTYLLGTAVCLATGRNLLGFTPRGRFRTLLWNGEDGIEELSRRVEAFCKHYEISPAETEGYLFLASGRDMPIDLVTIAENTRLAVPRDTEALIEALKAAAIDVLIIDPFISCHSVPENLNEAIDKVAQQLNLVAEKANCAVHVAHHSVKKRGAAVEAMDYRGGGAALAKLRYVQTFNRMDAKEATAVGVSPDDAWKYIRIDGDKPNLGPPDKARWYFMKSVSLDNADFERDGEFAEADVIGVPVPWEFKKPDLIDDILAWEAPEILAVQHHLGAETWALRSNSKQWVGVPLAKALGIDLGEAGKIERVKALIKTLEDCGALTKVDHRDERRKVVKRYQFDHDEFEALWGTEFG